MLELLRKAADGSLGRGWQRCYIRKRKCIEFLLVEGLPVEAAPAASHKAEISEQRRVRQQVDERSKSVWLRMSEIGRAHV